MEEFRGAPKLYLFRTHQTASEKYNIHLSFHILLIIMFSVYNNQILVTKTPTIHQVGLPVNLSNLPVSSFPELIVAVHHCALHINMSAWVWTQVLIFARQMLLHWVSHLISPKCSVYLLLCFINKVDSSIKQFGILAYRVTKYVTTEAVTCPPC